MKNLLSRLFGGVKMTWLKVILFAVATAAVTATFLIVPAFDDSPLRQMGIGYECWFVFAIFVISNCSKTLEAGLKTFVFFLISQPLIYLFQQPFAEVDLLRSYYYKWFLMTLLTFPGGMLAYMVKKDRIFSPFILACAGAFLGWFGTMGAINSISSWKISYFLYALFFVVFALLIAFPLMKKKRNRILYLIVVGAVILGTGVYTVVDIHGSGKIDYYIEKEGTWEIAGYSSDGIAAEMEDEDTITFSYTRNSHGTVQCRNGQDETIELTIDVKKGIPQITENPVE